MEIDGSKLDELNLVHGEAVVRNLSHLPSCEAMEVFSEHAKFFFFCGAP